MRIYLSGRISMEEGSYHVAADAFPGRQGRIVFAYLVCERSRPVARSELMEALWPTALPPSHEIALSAVISKLRTMLGVLGLSPAEVLTSAAGCYDLRLPGPVWVDHEAAFDAIHEAESALAAADPARAYGPSAVAHHIARRPFLPGEEGHWIDQRREKLRAVLLRALECRAEVYLWNHEFPLAADAATEALELNPFRESAYRLLMRAHAAAGNAAEALIAYERCRARLSDELGVAPSPQTKDVHAGILRAL